MIGALAPDFDLSYFYLIDHRQTHHHRYVTHWPALWLSLVAVSAIWLRLKHAPKVAFVSVIFCLGGLLHVVLDSFVGDIWWLAPFVDRPFALFTVPAVFAPWWLNFILHWSFAVELVISAWALFIYRRRRRRRAWLAQGTCLVLTLHSLPQRKSPRSDIGAGKHPLPTDSRLSS